MNERYNVVLEGKVRPEASREAVIPDLAALIGRDASFARGLLSGQPVVLRSNVSQAEADDALAALRRIGVLADLEPAANLQIDPDVDVRLNQRPRPALWNPNAAANWSLLFTPVFGSYLHLRNWQSLRADDRVKGAKVWFVVSLVVLVSTIALSVLVPTADNSVRALNFLYLVFWYFATARSQAKYVKREFGKDYVRNGWTQPLLIAIIAVVATMVLAGMLQSYVGSSSPQRPGTTLL